MIREGDFIIDDLLLDPEHPTTLYAHESLHIMKSTDGGNTWRSVLLLLSAGIAVSFNRSGQSFRFQTGRVRHSIGRVNMNRFDSLPSLFLT